MPFPSLLNPFRSSAAPVKKKVPAVKQNLRLPLPLYVALSVGCLASSGAASDYLSMNVPAGQVSALAVSSSFSLVLLSLFFGIIAVIKIKNPSNRRF